MTKTFTNEQKHQATKQAVVSLLQASGPCDMPEIIREVKAQAFAGCLVKVLCELRQSLTIRYDADDQSFDMFQ